jgi:uncharacterized protein YegP (UPF0339 family)
MPTRPSHRIEYFSTKSPLRRRQYRARIRELISGNVIMITSEGYNNRADCREAVVNITHALGEGDFEIVEYGPNGTTIERIA